MKLVRNLCGFFLPYALLGLALGFSWGLFQEYTRVATFTATVELSLNPSKYDFDGSVEQAVELINTEISKLETKHINELEEISIIKNTDKLKIQVRSFNPISSSALANKAASKSLEKIKSWQKEKQTKHQELLQVRLAELNEEIKNTETEFYANGEAQAAWSDQNLMFEKLEKLNKELSKLESERKTAENSLNGGDLSRTLLDNDSLVVALGQELEQVEKEIQELSKTLKPAHPSLKYLLNLKSELENERLQRKQRLFTDLESDFELTGLKIKAHKEQITEIKQELGLRASQLAKYKELENNLKVLKEQQSKLLSNALEARINVSNSDPILTLYSKARVPNSKDSQLDWNQVGLSGLIGAMLTVMIFFISFAVMRKPGNKEVVEAYLSHDVLAQIPAIDLSLKTGITTENRKAISFKGENSIETNEVVHLYPQKDEWQPKDVNTDESFRDLSMQFVRSSQSESMSILVTSSTVGEGKSTISHNLGRAFSRAGYKTLIIDTHLTWPPVFGSKRGLAEYLAQSMSIEQIIEKSNIPGLYTVASGNSEPDSREMLCSKRMWELVSFASKAFDYVIFDGPPVLANNDVLILSEIADSALLVVDSQLSDKRQAREAIQKLERNDCTLKGVIMNRSAAQHISQAA